MQNSNNNIYTDFPALMEDSRLLTQYSSNVNEEIRNKLGLKYNWQYRDYLMNNSNEVIEYNKTNACREILSCYNNSSCIYQNNGIVDINQPSDLKKKYLEKEVLQKRLTTVEVPQYKMLQKRHPRTN